MKTKANKSVEPNRRPAFPLGAGRQFGKGVKHLLGSFALDRAR